MHLPLTTPDAGATCTRPFVPSDAWQSACADGRCGEASAAAEFNGPRIAGRMRGEFIVSTVIQSVGSLWQFGVLADCHHCWQNMVVLLRIGETGFVDLVGRWGSRETQVQGLHTWTPDEKAPEGSAPTVCPDVDCVSVVCKDGPARFVPGPWQTLWLLSDRSKILLTRLTGAVTFGEVRVRGNGFDATFAEDATAQYRNLRALCNAAGASIYPSRAPSPLRLAAGDRLLVRFRQLDRYAVRVEATVNGRRFAGSGLQLRCPCVRESCDVSSGGLEDVRAVIVPTDVCARMRFDAWYVTPLSRELRRLRALVLLRRASFVRDGASAVSSFVGWLLSVDSRVCDEVLQYI
eukprot:TRINITY_DN8045_c3_g1_i1.p1 TRINITY_DN8045_c3_g1~~TRINITY_DN8045_c3_g1_i1.p1  ORF type:complete len:348 (+),score=24.43 TRINITY_DN8045_c3_g1_i1:258-1301(+)